MATSLYHVRLGEILEQIDYRKHYVLNEQNSDILFEKKKAEKCLLLLEG